MKKIIRTKIASKNWILFTFEDWSKMSGRTGTKPDCNKIVIEI